MKTKLLNIVSIVMILCWLIGCGNTTSASSPESTTDTRGVTVRVNNPSSYKLVAQKTKNVDLVIDSMIMDVYKADSPTDSDLTDKPLFATKAFEAPSDANWSVKLEGMEKSKDYIFAVSAFNATDTNKPIFKGLTTATIAPIVETEVKINLKQSSGLYDDSDNFETIPRVSNILAVKDANGDIKLSFRLNNPNESLLTWSLFNIDGTTPSTEFSSNSGTTSDQLLAVELGYTKAIDATSSTYVLELKDENGATRSTFSIDLTVEGSDVNIEINTPPIIKSITATFVDDTVTFTSELDRESETITYFWKLTDFEGKDYVSTAKSIAIPFKFRYGFSIRLVIEDNNGAYSYRDYRFAPSVLISNSNQTVKKTGQVVSYNEDGSENKDGSIRDDAYYQYGTTPSFTRDDTRKIVIDNLTHLMWQDDENSKLNKYIFEAAKSSCDELELGGFTDWRLPKIYELEGIVERKRGINTKFKYTNFENNSYYWSSNESGQFSRNEATRRANFVVSMSKGFSYYSYVSRLLPVRCVRLRENIVNNRFRVGETIRDTLTRLEWQDGGASSHSWYDAINYCETLNLEGKGWRLPNINELKSIINYHENFSRLFGEEVSPRVYSEFKSTTKSDYVLVEDESSIRSVPEIYWSSTSLRDGARGISFKYGKEEGRDRKEKENSYVRCVR